MTTVQAALDNLYRALNPSDGPGVPEMIGHAACVVLTAERDPLEELAFQGFAESMRSVDRSLLSPRDEVYFDLLDVLDGAELDAAAIGMGISRDCDQKDRSPGQYWLLLDPVGHLIELACGRQLQEYRSLVARLPQVRLPAPRSARDVLVLTDAVRASRTAAYQVGLLLRDAPLDVLRDAFDTLVDLARIMPPVSKLVLFSGGVDDEAQMFWFGVLTRAVTQS